MHCILPDCFRCIQFRGVCSWKESDLTSVRMLAQRDCSELWVLYQLCSSLVIGQLWTPQRYCAEKAIVFKTLHRYYANITQMYFTIDEYSAELHKHYANKISKYLKFAELNYWGITRCINDLWKDILRNLWGANMQYGSFVSKSGCLLM